MCLPKFSNYIYSSFDIEQEISNIDEIIFSAYDVDKSPKSIIVKDSGIIGDAVIGDKIESNTKDKTVFNSNNNGNVIYNIIYTPKDEILFKDNKFYGIKLNLKTWKEDLVSLFKTWQTDEEIETREKLNDKNIGRWLLMNTEE